MLYAALSVEQRHQVEQLFHDELFEKDSAWFEYALDRQGQITTRVRLPEFKRAPARCKPRGALPVKLFEVTSPRPLTQDQQLKREIAYRVIARHLFQIIVQKGIPA